MLKPTVLKKHLEQLRGDIAAGAVVMIDEVNYRAKVPFNVYSAHATFKRLTDELKLPILTDEAYSKWLVDKKMIDVTSKESGVSYKTFPFCPLHNEVLKSVLIFSVCVGDDGLSKFTIRDVYVHALMKKFTIGFKHVMNRAVIDSYKTLLKSLSLDLSHRESKWKPGYAL